MKNPPKQTYISDNYVRRDGMGGLSFGDESTTIIWYCKECGFMYTPAIVLPHLQRNNKTSFKCIDCGATVLVPEAGSVRAKPSPKPSTPHSVEEKT